MRGGNRSVPLTNRQRDVLTFICGYRESHGVSPTLKEISAHFGFASPAGAQKHVLALEEKGVLTRNKGRHRGLIPRPRAVHDPSRSSTVPLLGLVAAGQPIESLPDVVEIPIPEDMTGPGEHFALRVRGDSMIDDGILDGDIVVVQARPEAHEGEVVVALIDGEVTLKRFYRASGDLVRLQPANAAMQPLMVPSSDVAIQGVVVGLLRRYP
ncbi:MAG: transcriptional repressor LexA [Acidobacteria bacterium]|nr:transcriptional repressor LexA [Acidobacteriota bacterium]